MPTEIADSDAESDLSSPVKQPATRENGNQNPLPKLASLSPINFDEYLGPTQKLSSSASHRATEFSQLDGSTEIIAARAADLQPTALFGEVLLEMNSKKRAHSALQDSLNGLQHEHCTQKPKVKRSKTYGATSRSHTAQDDNLFAPPPECSPEPRNLELTDPEGLAADQRASNTYAVAGGPSLCALTSTSDQTGVIPLLGRSSAGSTHCMTTSVASMGHYQSINIDFRGSGQGLNVNANPFGSLSQMSAQDDHNQARSENLTHTIEVDEAKSTHIGGNHHITSLHGTWQDQPWQTLSQSSPERPLAVNPAQIRRNDEAAPDTDGDCHFKVPETTNHVTDPVAAENVFPSMEKSPAHRKRGRKSKNSILPSKSPAPSIIEDPEDLAFSELPDPIGAQRGTVESLSQTSQTSTTNAPIRKRKRRKSKHMDEEGAEGNPAESLNMRYPVSELILSDEAAIELPKEAYKPRPSRSRSKFLVEDETEQQIAVSPAKQPTSELNLSDEAVIGLPKEAYKPRPSRTRSKKFVDEDAVPLSLPEADDDRHTPAKGNSDSIIEQQTPTITSGKSSTKKGRKSKVKRAKTSAAALLKKPDPMLSEGEEDVVWMDSKPAPVKLDLPPDLRALKNEPDIPKIEKDNKLGEESEQGKGAKRGNITIEIPSHAEVKDTVLEPKKRGRKPKKAEDMQGEQRIIKENEKEEESNSKSRPPLTDKPRNIPTGANKSLTGEEFTKAPTVSPITSPEPEVEKQAQSEQKDTSTGEDGVSKPITTPAKSKPSAPPPSTEKGPTKHSPINPPSLASSGRKVVYRIGLSRRQNIPSLLRKVDRDKPPPKNVVRKEKDSKKKKDMDAGDDGEGGGQGPGEMRGPDGMLIEWEF